MTCDNEFDLYVNGEKIGKGDTWTTTYQFNPIVKPDDVIALDGVDKGGPAAFIGVFNGKVTKASDWKCSTKKSDNWNKNNFDDSSWSYATSYGKNNQQNIWMSVGRGSRPNIPGDAEWLWTSDNENHNKVYCRFFFNGRQAQPVVAPVAQPAVAPVAQEVPQPKSVTTSKVVISPSVSLPSASASASTGALLKAKEACKPEVFPPTSHETIKTQVDEISKDTQQKMDALFTKFNTMVNDMSTKQKEQLEADKKVLNSTEQKSSSIYDKYKKEVFATSSLLDKMNALNSTLHSHLKTIRIESDYLSRLKIFKPTFLKSLDNVKTRVSDIDNNVHDTIVNGGDKNGLLSLLKEVQSSTEKSSALLAKAFMDHYDKYNSQLEKDNEKYYNDEKTLSGIKNEYGVEKTKRDKSLAEYNDIVTIIKQLKETHAISEKDHKLFIDLIQKVERVFKREENSIIKLSTSNTLCAADVLKAHMDGKKV